MEIALIELAGMEAGMGERLLVNKIPQLLAERNMNERDFLAECIRRGVSQATVARLLAGKTNTTTETLAKVADALNVASLCEVIDFGEQ